MRPGPPVVWDEGLFFSRCHNIEDVPFEGTHATRATGGLGRGLVFFPMYLPVYCLRQVGKLSNLGIKFLKGFFFNDAMCETHVQVG